ncbi:hypothetical protein OPIT5_21195 [Opitutaceae bacterium TAV5]|nr:hypothetical protein OPIT5_21195 [Opitutaceae bacterium TAV5]
MSGGAFVGHVNPKADRAVGRLVIPCGSVRRNPLTAGAVRDRARFLGVR